MIDELLAYAGIDDDYADAFGKRAVVSVESKLAILNALGYDVSDDASAARVLRDAHVADGLRRVKPVYVVRSGAAWPDVLLGTLDEASEPGYYDVQIGSDATRVIVVPPQAYVPSRLDAQSVWGIGAQLYSLRSESNWGIGDFGDLRTLMQTAARNGASFVGLNPLHQLHLSNPGSASPYAPLSRRYLNALYIDVADAAAEFGVRVDDIPLAHLIETPLIDYDGIAHVKLRALERIFDAAPPERTLDAYVAEHPGVRYIAIYEAIMEHLTRRNHDVYSWLQWPAELRDCNSEAVAAFAHQHDERVAFYIFLQWLADRQLARAVGEGSKMAVGLYRDLAVGADLASVDVWSDPDAYALRLSVGAPPDPLNALGQNWGLPPLHPRALVARAYEPFIALLRANMRHAGALRIDHVMGLRRLFCIPRELPHGGGAYVNYDFEAMLGIVALESHRNRCMVVGEDLGTVPEGFRERLAPERIFSCRVLLFERNEDATFLRPDTYPADAVASAGTHDLPTLAGYWLGADIDTRERLGWIDADAARAERNERAHSRELLAQALRDAGCLQGDDPSIEAIVLAAYRFLAKTNARMALVQLEDLLGQREQVNVPGTTTEEPNWKRKLSIPIESFESNELFAALLRVMREERPLNREAVA